MGLILLAFLLLAVFPASAGSGEPIIIPNGGILLACPEGKFLFEEQPIQKTEGYEVLSASVLIRGEGLKSETHLFTRNDGWTHLSSERTTLLPLQTVSNCLPQGRYDVRIEYYTKVPYIGDWLLGTLEYPLNLDHDILTDEALFISGVAGTYKDAEFYDHLATHWPLFAVYLVSAILFCATLIIFIRTIRKGRQK